MIWFVAGSEGASSVEGGEVVWEGDEVDFWEDDEGGVNQSIESINLGNNQ